ncbi:MAG: polysaccharide deacetylase [Clostridium sp.]|nr:polysaccharide deacetylase [Clostridium sp.]
MCLKHTVRVEEEAVVLVQGAENTEEDLDSVLAEDGGKGTQDSDNVASGKDGADESVQVANGKGNQSKRVYLTFDDGPSTNTEKILDILEEYDTKATFFVVGQEDEFSKKMYQRIVEEGHTLAMHSYSHNYSQIYKSKKAFFKDMQKIENLLYKTTGIKSIYYRFPGGTSNKVSKVSMRALADAITDEGYVYFDWNAMSGDASGKNLTKKQLITNVLEDVEIHNTSVVLMHDAADKKKTVEMLPVLLKKLKKMNVKILPIDKDTPLIQHVKAKG